MWLLNFLFFIFVVNSKASEFDYNLKQYIRQGLDAITQDVLAQEESHLFHSYKFNSGFGNREELVVRKIRSDDAFDKGENVTEWQTINIPDRSIAVGKMSSGFTITSTVPDKKSPTGYATSSGVVGLKYNSTAFTMYKQWNIEKMKYDVFVIVATLNDHSYIQWLRVEDNNDLQRFHWWNVPQKVTHLKIIQHGDSLKLFVVYEKLENSDVTTGEINNILFHINGMNYTVHQKIFLDDETEFCAVNKYGSKLFLSIPQQLRNEVIVFQLNANNDKFELYQTIHSKNVDFVTDFNIAYRSFLAIGGLNPAIYRFTANGLKAEDIFDIHLQEVTYILPIPVKTYRDEVMLLVQHNINYSTHVAPYVKVLIYSNGIFYPHDDIPCQYLGAITNGATCMADLDLDTGIIGSAVLAVGKNLGVLVPRFQEQSGLFIFDWVLEKVQNPITKKVEKVVKSRIQIEKLIKQQQKTINEIENTLQNSVIRDKDNEITGHWKINVLVTPNVVYENYNYNHDYDRDDYAENYSFDIMENDLKNIIEEIDSLQGRMFNRRSRNPNDYYEFDRIEIKGDLVVQDQTFAEQLCVDKINDEVFNHMVEDCVKKSEDTYVIGTKTFQRPEIEHLYFENLNNNSAENIAHISDNEIHITGDAIFEYDLKTHENVLVLDDGFVNGMKLKEELVYMDSEYVYDNINFENIIINNLNNVKYINNESMTDIIKYKNLNYDGLNIEADYIDLSYINITTKKINGENFRNFINSLCHIDEECSIPGNVTINGKLKIYGSADINTLNNLRYPEEYLLPKDPKLFTKITGNKVFTGTVRVSEVGVNGLIDGLNPEDIITCTVDQTVDGNFTFEDLEISESFTVEGDILVGKDLKKFVPNPTLEATKHVKTDVLFTNIEVEGDVIVKNLFNSTTIKQWFEDVVYKDEEIVSINSEKKFTRRIDVESNLNIDSNMINNVDLRQLLTINTDQIVSDNVLSGKIVVDNLEITGQFNKMKLKQAFDDLILLDKDEVINSELTLNQITSVPQIMGDEIHIDSVNDMKSSDIYLTVGDRTFKTVEFNKVNAEYAEFAKDFNYEVELFDIEEFANTRFSLTKDQTITGNMTALDGSVDNINSEMINGQEWSFLKDYLNISDNCHSRLLAGELKIDELIVNGSLNTDGLNDYNLRKIYKNAFWINRTNEVFSKIIFEDEVSVKDLEVNTLNREKFADFINDIVLKNATNVDFKGEKVFHSGFNVAANVDVNELNGIKVENILLKTGDQEIIGNIVVHGDVTVDENLIVHKDINGIRMKKLVDMFRVKDDSFIITGNVSFKNDISIENLIVKGKGNGIHSNEYLNNIVGVNDDVDIPGTTIFKRKVHIHKNLGVANTVDDVNLNTLMDDVVLTSRDDFIHGKVTFTQDVIVEDTIELDNDLETKFISSCDIEDWKNRAVYLTDGYLKGNLKFEDVSFKTNIDVEYLNGIDMKILIPLHTNQTIDSLHVGFMRVENNFQIGHLISGFNFTKEFENSVLVDNDQTIFSKLIFSGAVSVLHNLKTTNLVNGVDLQRIVTTNTEQNLSASYIFNGKIIIDSDMTVKGKVNKINVTDWSLKTVTGVGAEEQNIMDSWLMGGNVTFQQDVLGNGLLGGIEIKRLANEVDRKQRDKFEIEDKIKSEYHGICVQVENMVNISKTRPLLFKYLDYQDSLHFNYRISEIHHFKYNYRYFLIVNLKMSCESLLYEWIPNSFHYITSLATGEVEQFITVYDENQVYLVTKHPSSSCKEVGVNVWIFNGNTLTHIHALNNTLMLAKAKLPGVFYSVDSNFVTEYKLSFEHENPVVHEYKQWNIPRLYSIDTKLGMTRNKFASSVDKKESDVEYYYEAPAIIDEIRSGIPEYLPELPSKEHIKFNITYGEAIIGMTAVAIWEDALVGGLTDVIKIYKNVDDRLFDKIPTYRPSNLRVLDFGKSGETFLAFLENNEVLKLYEADGNGFKPRTIVKRPATKMLTVSLPLAPYQSKRKFLVLINKTELIFLQAVMDGDRSTENFYCDP